MPYRSTRVSVSLTRRKAGFAKFVTDMSPTPRCHESAPVSRMSRIRERGCYLSIPYSVASPQAVHRSQLTALRSSGPFCLPLLQYRRLLLPIARRCYISGHKSLSLHCEARHPVMQRFRAHATIATKPVPRITKRVRPYDRSPAFRLLLYLPYGPSRRRTSSHEAFGRPVYPGIDRRR